MGTKVLVITHQKWVGDDGKWKEDDTLQSKVDKAISELGGGWIVRSAETNLCLMGTSTISSGIMLSSFKRPSLHYATTIVLEKS